MENLVFTQLSIPEIRQIFRQELETFFANEKNNSPVTDEADQFLTIQQASEFLNLKVSTLYGLVHEKKIPVSKPGKHLFFSKRELTEWVQAGRKKTAKELGAEAEAIIKSKGKK